VGKFPDFKILKTFNPITQILHRLTLSAFRLTHSASTLNVFTYQRINLFSSEARKQGS